MRLPLILPMISPKVKKRFKEEIVKVSENGKISEAEVDAIAKKCKIPTETWSYKYFKTGVLKEAGIQLTRK